MEDSRERLLGLCVARMKSRCAGMADLRDRLKHEIREIDNQAEHDYFLDLHDRGARFPRNENNLLVPFLLGLTDEFDPSSESAHVQGEFPDIDVDYLPAVQEYLRNEWCPKTFGRDKVVNIGNYGTFGIKSALLDMARVHGADYQEIQTITKNLVDKDEDGRPLSWEKALEATPDLAAYCERNPEIADSARRLIDRNRGRGKHAGGTVVSSIKIADLVPIMIDTDGNPVSGWTEGLNEQDLQPVGLIKFDVLAVKDLLRIAHCCHLVKQRHGLESVSAKEGGSDWSDTSYLNDPKALEIANRAETRGIFQFDGDGMRKLIKSGGVDRFEDLVAYSALFRPATIGLRMHERYVERKRGREEWEDSVPECVRDILSKTYGVMCYQEQIMKILNVVGDIPLIHCEKIRKAISKKKTGEFVKYKQMFLENGSRKTGWPIESSDDRNMKFLWSLIENFSSYGFNVSHSVAYTHTSSRLLYLKAHYPLEFFCSTLGLEGDEDKVKFYKREAERSGITVNRCDLARSGVNYEIVGDEIYVGFKNIKGIGDEVAEKIVAGKPYKDFPDFLDRFGTDKRVLEPLINLGVFKDAPPNVLTEFYEDYKKWTKGNSDKEKRNQKRRDELLETMRSMVRRKVGGGAVTHEFVMSLCESGDHSPLEGVLSDDYSPSDFMGVAKKYARSVLNFEHKRGVIERNSISFENWEPEGRYPADKWPSVFEVEKRHYGFSWEHPIQKSPDYVGGHSFAIFSEDESNVHAGVEVVVVKKPVEKVSKSGSKYYYVFVEDEDWNEQVITFWSEDYKRFSEELEFWDDVAGRGNFLKMRVTRPSAGFRSYTFQSPPKRDRHRLVPADKKMDARLQVMRPPGGNRDAE
jgi:DNA polymerase III alpha subunit